MRTTELESRISANVTLLGCSGVGKTALVVRYLTKRYIGDYISGTDMTYKCQLQFMRMRLRIKILDPSGDMTKNRIRNIVQFRQSENDVIILVYSVDDPDSFRYVSELLPEVLDIAPCALVLVIGNKADLDESRAIYDTDVEKLASRHEFIHMNASAKSSSDDAAKIFVHSINLLMERKRSKFGLKDLREEVEEQDFVLQPPPRARRRFTGNDDRKIARRATIEVDLTGRRRDRTSNGPSANRLNSKPMRNRSNTLTGNFIPSISPVSITVTPNSDDSKAKCCSKSKTGYPLEMPKSAPPGGRKSPAFLFPDLPKKENSDYNSRRNSNSMPNTPANVLSPLKRNNSFFDKIREAFAGVPQRLRSPK